MPSQINCKHYWVRHRTGRRCVYCELLQANKEPENTHEFDVKRLIKEPKRAN